MNRSRDSIRVLHVDDEADFADMAATFLEREHEGMTVETAGTGSEGLDRLADGQFDCVVSDYEMGGRTGIEFLELVRETHDDLPFILYTGKGSEEVASDAISAGVTDYLQKERGPDQFAVLANRIVNAVEHYRSRRLVERSERQLRQIVDHLPHLLYVVDEDETYVLANETLADFHGLSVDEMEGSAVEDVLDRASYEQFRDDLRTVLETGEPRTIPEVEIAAPDGAVHVFEPRLLPYDFADTDSRTALGIAVDVTDRKERERTLRRYETLVETMQEGGFAIDADGDCVSVDQMAAVPYPPAALLGQSASTLTASGVVDERTAADHRETLERMLAGEVERTTRRLTAPASDGDERVVETVFSLVRTEDGTIEVVVGAARDVTGRDE